MKVKVTPRVKTHLMEEGGLYYVDIRLEGLNRHQAVTILSRLGSTAIKNGVGTEEDYIALTRNQLDVVGALRVELARKH